MQEELRVPRHVDELVAEPDLVEIGHRGRANRALTGLSDKCLDEGPHRGGDGLGADAYRNAERGEGEQRPRTTNRD